MQPSRIPMAPGARVVIRDAEWLVRRVDPCNTETSPLVLTLEELQTIYRVKFPLMRQYESDTWYDQTGRIIFTNSKGHTGVGLPRKARKGDTGYGIDAPGRKEENIALGWEDTRDLEEGAVSKTFMDDTLPGGPRERTVEYVAPFDRCNREEDYAVVWGNVEERDGD